MRASRDVRNRRRSKVTPTSDDIDQPEAAAGCFMTLEELKEWQDTFKALKNKLNILEEKDKSNQLLVESQKSKISDYVDVCAKKDSKIKELETQLMKWYNIEQKGTQDSQIQVKLKNENIEKQKQLDLLTNSLRQANDQILSLELIVSDTKRKFDEAVSSSSPPPPSSSQAASDATIQNGGPTTTVAPPESITLVNTLLPSQNSTQTNENMMNFSGTAGDMMALMVQAGISFPEVQEAAMRVAEAEGSQPKECSDPNCGHDHSHNHEHGHNHEPNDHHDHSHNHEHGHNHEPNDHHDHSHNHEHGHNHEPNDHHDHSHNHEHGHNHEPQKSNDEQEPKQLDQDAVITPVCEEPQQQESSNLKPNKAELQQELQVGEDEFVPPPPLSIGCPVGVRVSKYVWNVGKISKVDLMDDSKYELKWEPLPLEFHLESSNSETAVSLMKAQLNNFCAHVKHMYHCVGHEAAKHEIGRRKATTTIQRGSKVVCWYQDGYYLGEVVEKETEKKTNPEEEGGKEEAEDLNTTTLLASSDEIKDVNHLWFSVVFMEQGDETSMVIPSKYIHRSSNNGINDLSPIMTPNDDETSFLLNLSVGEDVYIPHFGLISTLAQNGNEEGTKTDAPTAIVSKTLIKAKIQHIIKKNDMKLEMKEEEEEEEENSAPPNVQQLQLQLQLDEFYSRRDKYEIRLVGSGNVGFENGDEEESSMLIPYPDSPHLIQQVHDQSDRDHLKLLAQDQKLSQDNNNNTPLSIGAGAGCVRSGLFSSFQSKSNLVFCDLSHVDSDDVLVGRLQTTKRRPLYLARILHVKGNNLKTRPIYEIECVIDGQLTRHKNVDNHHHHYHHHRHHHHHHHHSKHPDKHHHHKHHHEEITDAMYDVKKSKLILLQALSCDDISVKNSGGGNQSKKMKSLKKNTKVRVEEQAPFNEKSTNDDDLPLSTAAAADGTASTSTATTAVSDDGIAPPVEVGTTVLTRYKNKPGGKYFLSVIKSAKLMEANELFYDITYDDGDAEIGVHWSKVKPLARLLKKAAEELKVGDETIVAFRGKKHMKFLGKVGERHGEGEHVSYSIQYADGDEEKFVERVNITPLDLIALRASQPPVPSPPSVATSADNTSGGALVTPSVVVSWQPLEVGCQVMAAPRGLNKWYSGIIANVRTGKHNPSFSSSSSSGSKAKGKGKLQWVYDIYYPVVEENRKGVGKEPLYEVLEEHVCSGVVAPVAMDIT